MRCANERNEKALFRWLDERTIDVAADGSQQDDQDGRNAKQPDGQGTANRNPTVGPREFGSTCQIECRHSDEGYHRRTYAAEDGSHHGVVLKLMEEHGKYNGVLKRKTE